VRSTRVSSAIGEKSSSPRLAVVKGAESVTEGCGVAPFSPLSLGCGPAGEWRALRTFRETEPRVSAQPGEQAQPVNLNTMRD
jgi:hypothetical protein